MNRKRNSILAKVLNVCLALFLLGCNSAKETKELLAHGFIVFSDPDDWFFIPSKSINSSNCYDDFKTENLSAGFQIMPNFKERHFILDLVDSIELTDKGQFIMIAPVALTYRISQGQINKASENYFNFNLASGLVEFNFDLAKIDIENVTPLFCMDKKESDIAKCECKHKEDDPDDYLFKVCTKLKADGDKSTFPCKYGIKKVTESLLNGSEVIEVELTCCFMGDVAYFDPVSKELIDFKYGYR